MTRPRTVEEAWSLIRGIPGAPESLNAAGLTLGAGGRLTEADLPADEASSRRTPSGTEGPGDQALGPSAPGLPPEVRALLEIFLPLQLRERWVVGQLGQSLDGRIATESGHSHYINGPEDIRRLHGLRALADAVVIGAGTALSDDPRLTARQLPGPSPIRVVLDPRGRLPDTLNVFSDDGPPTLWIQDGDADPAEPPDGVGEPRPGGHHSGARRLTRLKIPADARGHLPPAAILGLLRARGLDRILVEGGGRTVSTFLEAGLLDRLHICVAPLLIGSGRPGITLPRVETLDEALRPRVRHHSLGRDVLFDLALSPDA